MIYVDHYGIEGMIRAARIAHDAGAIVFGDLERDEWPGYAELEGMVDHLVVNQAFAQRRTGFADPAAAAERLLIAGRKAVVVTCGVAGSWWVSGETRKVDHQPAFEVPVVDTTGCGDVFHGAYGAALVRGLPVAECVQFASAAAAIKAMSPGAQRGSPSWAQVEAFLDRDGADQADLS
jgi:sulfofructose kinase